VNASDGRLTADVRGEVEDEHGVLVIRRIHATLILRTAEEHRSTAERVHGLYAEKCPVYRSLIPAIAITSSLQFEAEPKTNTGRGSS